jgi:hypothetical protein
MVAVREHQFLAEVVYGADVRGDGGVVSVRGWAGFSTAGGLPPADKLLPAISIPVSAASSTTAQSTPSAHSVPLPTPVTSPSLPRYALFSPHAD